MSKRAGAIESAQDVFLAVELARRGAGTALISSLTGFGPRWTRAVVRENGGLTSKSNEPVRWFQKDPQRLIHGRLMLFAYERQPASLSAGYRLLAAYDAYREIACQPGLLGVGQCANLIQLYQKGDVATRLCVDCRLPYLILSEKTLCPVCHLVRRMFCLGCGEYMKVSDATLALGRRYCTHCGPQKRTLRRQKQHVTLRSTGLSLDSVSLRVAEAQCVEFGMGARRT